jgi:hypothetical protein
MWQDELCCRELKKIFVLVHDIKKIYVSVHRHTSLHSDTFIVSVYYSNICLTRHLRKQVWGKNMVFIFKHLV